jgi:hypothetical protein
LGSLGKDGLKYNVYPNPANSQITVSLEETDTDLDNIQIEDVIGRVLIQQRVKGNQVGIDIQSLISGLYFVKIKTANGKEGIRKFVKE